MTDHEKKFLERESELDTIVGHISEERKELEVMVANPRETFARLKAEEREKFYFFHTQRLARLHSAKFLEKSPFFVRLTLQFDDKAEQELVYIGKFSFLDDKIYSWTVPVAGLRFVPPGRFSYVRPNGQTRSGVVFTREDYFIGNGKILSLNNVTLEGRELIYDEYVSTKKVGFGLSDIVRELERAQNEIIVLDPKGLMVISGPAGSGKTTLALHRVAYLLQNPDTSETYRPEHTIIFIQDESSLGYFSSLFINLGVEDVTFITFESWCAKLLGLPEDAKYTDRYGDSSRSRDWYEWNKVRLIAETAPIPISKNTWRTLDLIYSNQQDTEFVRLWKRQKSEQVLDKQDLTVLLKNQITADGGRLLQPKKVFKKKAGKMVPVMVRDELSYDTILVDEFENYTRDQLRIIATTYTKTSSCLLVGDIHQQTKFGSISDFSQSSMIISDDRNIVLSKVYRNGSSVIALLRSVGYTVSSDNRKDGGGIGDWIVVDEALQIDIIKKYLSSHPEEQVGIISYDEDAVGHIRSSFLGMDHNAHIGVVTEFQGLEFDTVFIMGVNMSVFEPTGLHEQFDAERGIVLRERLYVAITRARENVTIFSDSERQEITVVLFKKDHVSVL